MFSNLAIERLSKGNLKMKKIDRKANCMSKWQIDLNKWNFRIVSSKDHTSSQCKPDSKE